MKKEPAYTRRAVIGAGAATIARVAMADLFMTSHGPCIQPDRPPASVISPASA